MAARSAPTRSRAPRSGWAGNTAPFVVPDDLYAEWRQAGSRGVGRAAGMGTASRRRSRRQARPNSSAAFKGELPQDFDAVIAKVCDDFRAKNAKIATRQASGEVLDALVPAVPELIGGSADLTPSNNTKAKDETEIKPGDFAGRYIHFGIREHGMARGDERHRRAWRANPLWRHVSDLYRLRPPGDPPVGADGGPRRLCDDARFDRSRRGRADASAGRASRGLARDPASPGVPPGRPGRDRRVLGAGAEEWAPPVDPGADKAERAAAAHRTADRRAPPTTSAPAAPMCWSRPRASGR